MRIVRAKLHGWRVLAHLGALAAIVALTARADGTVNPSAVFISQLHYDDDGNDDGECLEISGPAGTDLSSYGIVRYNGSNGAAYTTPAGPGALGGILPNEAGTGYGALAFSYPVNGLQNGAPDAIALVQGSTCVELLSYEGVFNAVGGACDGLGSTDLGVAETDDDVGSLKRSGAGLQNVQLSWTGPSAGNCDGLLNFTPGSSTVTDRAIFEIQGSAVSFESVSPFEGDLVRTTGVVTAVFQVNGMGGFYIQDPVGDGALDTSDGIFVANTSTSLQVGQTVRVTGTVVEQESGTTIAVINESTNPDTTVVGNRAGSETAIGATLVEITNPAINLVAATELELPILPPLDDSELERYEGMYVHVATDAANDEMWIAQTYFLGRYGQLSLAAPPPSSGVLEPLIQPTQVFTPTASAASPVQQRWLDNERRKLILDDGQDLSAQGDNPNPSPYNDDCASVVRSGDRIGNLYGILDWGRVNSGPSSDFDSDYRLQPLDPAAVVISTANPRPAAPNTPGGVIVAAINLFNYFTDFQGGAPAGSDFRGAFDAPELARQTDKLVKAICALDAHIVGLVELQNPASGDLPLETLVDGGVFAGVVINGLNDEPGCGTYTALSTGRNGTDAIKNGLIFKASHVTLEGEFTVLTDGLSTQQNRPTLVQTFSRAGDKFTVAVNHFKSKRPSCNSDQGDLAGDCNLERAAFANRVRTHLQNLANTGGDPDVIAIGDFNSYGLEAPIREFEDNGWLDTVGRDEGDLAQDYIFDGAVGSLSYAIASPTMEPKVLAAESWRINADEAQMLEYGTPPWYIPPACYQVNPYRSSDHDPIRIALNVGAASVPVLGAGRQGLAAAGLAFLALGALALGIRRR